MTAGTVIFDASELQKQFIRLGRRARDFDHSLITALLLEFVEEVFDTQGVGGQDGKWDDFEPSTLKRHPKRSGGQLLLDTGILANFQSATAAQTSIVFTPANYGIRHVEGTKNMAKRNPFAIKEKEFMQEAETIIALEIGH